MNSFNKAFVAEGIRLIAGAVKRESLDLPVWRTRNAAYTPEGKYEDYGPWETISVGTVWNCRFNEARFFETEFTVPASMEGQRLVLELSVGGEGIVSVNGERRCGIAFWKNQPGTNPQNRERVFLTENGKAGESYRIEIQTNVNYKDAFRGGRFLKYTESFSQTYEFRFARLCAVDRETETYWLDLTSVWDEYAFLRSPLEEALFKLQPTTLEPAVSRELLRTNRDRALLCGLEDALQSSLLRVPFFDGPEAIRQAAEEARELLWNRIGEIRREKEGTVVASGFSHIDVVWLWQLKHTIRKISATMLNVLDLMDRYPELTFSFSQPYTFALLKEHDPEIFEKVRQKVAEGRILPVGNLWVEIDTNLPSGESIVRQLLYGRAFYRENFGMDSDVFFMPDSFGYSAQLPQIIARSGVRYFYTSKLSTNEYLRFPHTLFTWQGIDGTGVPAYLQRVSYNGGLEAARLEAVLGYAENRNLVDTVMLPFGYGDGGGGPTHGMLEQYRRVNRLPGIPNVEMGGFSSFYETACEKENEFPVWNDEIYFDRHRGVLTSHGEVKKNNRRAELLLRQLETAASMREILLDRPYPAAPITELWKQMLSLQAHDTLTGDSITLVYDDVAREYASFFEKAEALFKEILDELTASVRRSAESPVYWNFLSWPRKFLRTDGEKRFARLPSLGWKTCGPENGPEGTEGVSAGEHSLENRFFLLKLGADGTVESVFDKVNGRQVLRQPGNVLEVYDEVEKNYYSAFDVERLSLERREELRGVNSIRLVENSAERGVIRVERTYKNSTVTQDVILYSELPRIDFVTHVDWRENMKLLKTAFYPNVHANRAAFEIQFGTIERPTHRNTEYDEARFETCGQKWADLSQRDFGVSILNDCKYGYDVHEDAMRLTLLRSSVEPDYKADRGIHDFTYSLYPHRGSWADGGTVRAGYELNVPAVRSDEPARSGAFLEEEESFLSVSGDGVILDAFKKAENGRGYVLRFYEAQGGGGKTEVRFRRTPKKVTECDLMERDEKTLTPEQGGFSFETRPYKIHSFRVEF